VTFNELIPVIFSVSWVEFMNAATKLVPMTSSALNVSTLFFISDPAISLTNKSDLVYFSAFYMCIVCYKLI